MISGHVRDNFPYVMLTLPGQSGPLTVEFLVDTGFEGDLALPDPLLMQLDADFVMDKNIRMADGSIRKRPHYVITLDWDEEPRPTEVLALEGVPLMGISLLRNYLIQIEMTDGGEVSLEPL